jgi:2-polyprenyl-3-methyl-5-hydroxy-6-metoxy-1,4-benzoquinol methylase
MEHDLDIVVLLHGDGQYAPELLPEMVAPLERDEADAVFGSRMMSPGAARRGGMPLYKYAGNRILTAVENAVGGASLSEWHSGYRAYSVAALRELPLEQASDGFDFDTQVILQLLEAGKRIVEIPIPTYYGDEICYVNGMKYAKDVTRAVVRYRAHKMGFGTGETAFATNAYEFKDSENSSHGRILSWLAARPPSRILDLGCGDGELDMRLRVCGHEVTGVDLEKADGIGERLYRFVEGDLDQGIPDEVGDGYDIVLAADVLEHVREPDQLLRDIRGRIRPGGTLVTSVPNFGHWYPRLRVAAGRFDYDRRGILDRGHLRFFTRRSFETLLAATGFEVCRRDVVGLPVEVSSRGAGDSDPISGGARATGALDRVAVDAWPTLFGYQFIYEVTAKRDL